MINPIIIRGKSYQPQKGDYILDNGACKQFCTGDKRILIQEGFDSYDSIVLTKAAIKQINIAGMRTKVGSNNCQYYFFD
jgi:hypothetical protein